MNPINRIKEFQAKKKSETDILEEFAGFIREFGSIGDVLGRDFEIRDPQGKLLATVRQKPMTYGQFNSLKKGLYQLKQKENAEMNSASNNIPKKGKRR